MISRRKFLGTGAASTVASVAGLTVGGIGGAAVASLLDSKAYEQKAATSVGDASVSATGRHQAGIELELQSHARFIALDLDSTTDRAVMRRWLPLLADDIRRLTAGQPVLADPQPQLAESPSRLTVTIGFGVGLFEKLGLEATMPAGFGRLPKFKIDTALLDEFSDGDVLIQIACDDLPMLNHASRALIRDSETFAQVRWVQDGFANAQGVVLSGVRQRNMMGQVDGTDNPELASEDFDNLVWIKNGAGWVAGGTMLALRRIKMNLRTWDTMSTDQKEQVIGRKLDSGAPLGGARETDAPDFEARDANGLRVIPEFAHIRNAAPRNLDERFFRRPFNYVDAATGETGLLWTAYAANLQKQYVPVQTRLAEGDLLSVWTTPVGSATFFIPSGFDESGYPGEGLF